MTSFVTEVTPFLQSNRNDLKISSIELLLQLSENPDEVSKMTEKNFLNLICNCLSCKEVSLKTLQLLTNIVASNVSVGSNLDYLLLINTAKSILSVEENINTFLMLLSNLTLSAEFCRFLCSDDASVRDILLYLVNCFLNYDVIKESESSTDWELFDKWQYMSSVICNLTQEQQGREIFLQPSYNFSKEFIVHVTTHLYTLIINFF